MLVAGAGSALLAPGGATPMFTALNFEAQAPFKKNSPTAKDSERCANCKPAGFRSAPCMCLRWII